MTLNLGILYWYLGWAYCCLNKMAAILQMTIPNAFCWMKRFIFWSKFHWNLSLRVNLTISQHWFWCWLGTKLLTSRYLNWCWSRSQMQCGATISYQLHRPSCVHQLEISEDEINSPMLSKDKGFRDFSNNFNEYCFNSLWPSDAIRRQGTESTLAQVMACCLTAPSHYLNQCLLIVSKVLWHSSEGIIMRRSEDTHQ